MAVTIFRFLALLFLITDVNAKDDLTLKQILNRLQDQDNKIDAQNEKIEALEAHVQKLEHKDPRHTSFLGFYASTNSGRSLANGVVLTFDLVEINAGNDYVAGTGTYTCPESGVYQFTSFQMSTSNDAGFGIYVNGEYKGGNVVAGSSYPHTGISVIAQCDAGQTAQVKCARNDGCAVRDTPGQYQRSTSFSGFLIHQG